MVKAAYFFQTIFISKGMTAVIDNSVTKRCKGGGGSGRNDVSGGSAVRSSLHDQTTAQNGVTMRGGHFAGSGVRCIMCWGASVLVQTQCVLCGVATHRPCALTLRLPTHCLCRCGMWRCVVCCWLGFGTHCHDHMDSQQCKPQCDAAFHLEESMEWMRIGS
jgi:hypothetical protein